MGKITKKFEGVRQRGKKYEWRAEYMGVKAGKSGYDTPEKAYIARMQWLDDAKSGYAVKPTKAKVFVAGKSYGAEITIPLNVRDDIVWRGKLPYAWFEECNGQSWPFGNVALTFEIIEH